MLKTRKQPYRLGGRAPVLLAEITGNAASQVALQTNTGRTHALVMNIETSTTPVWLGLGVAARTNQGIRLAPGAVLEIDADWYYDGAINFYGAATATVAVWEA